MHSLQILIKAITEHHASDLTTPSVILSEIIRDMRQIYYGSIARYTEKFGQGKYIICKTTADTLEQVIDNLVKEFLKTLGRGGAVDQLDKLLSDQRKPE